MPASKRRQLAVHLNTHGRINNKTTTPDLEFAMQRGSGTISVDSENPVERRERGTFAFNRVDDIKEMLSDRVDATPGDKLPVPPHFDL